MTLLNRLAATALISGGLFMPAQAYDLQYRQNGTAFSAPQLREIFNQSLLVEYDQRFPDQHWTTYLLLDAHTDNKLVAITLGLSPRVGPKQALLPLASFSVIEPLPRTPVQWQQLLGGVANQYAKLILDNSSRILNQR